MGRLKSKIISSVFELQGFNLNTGTETVTVETGFTVRKQTHTNEYYNETVPTKYMIYGRVKRGIPKTVATIKVEAESGKFFTSPPSLNTNFKDNIKLSVKSVGKVNNNVTSYVLDLIYVNSIATYTTSALTASLRYYCQTIYVKPIRVDSISFGNTLISASGERREIKIHGHKDAVFALSINNDEDLSIIDSSQTTSTIINNNGISIPIIKRKIGKNGVYSFYQKFPSINRKSTTLSAAVSTSRTIQVYNGDDIKVGDKAICKKISFEKNVTVSEINPAGGVDSIKEILLSESVTIPINTPISFQRQSTYKINMISSLSSTLGSSISTTYPGYTLYQYIDPTLTLKVSTATELLTINGGGSGAEYYQYLAGRANTKARNTGRRGLAINATDLVSSGYVNNFKVTLNLAVVDTASHTFTVARKPLFSKTIANIGQGSGIGTPAKPQVDNGSDWTNTVVSDNGGTDISIHNIAIGSTGATTLAITYYVSVKKWGTEDVVMELDLDRILTVA
jgi:hypothetical protein